MGIEKKVLTEARYIRLRMPREITKFEIKKVGSKHFLYAYTGKLERAVIGKYPTFERAIAALEGIKSRMK